METYEVILGIFIVILAIILFFGGIPALCYFMLKFIFKIKNAKFKRYEIDKEKVRQNIKSNGFIIDQELSNGSVLFCIDDYNKKWCLSCVETQVFIMYNFSDLIDFKVKIENHKRKKNESVYVKYRREYKTRAITVNEYELRLIITVNDIKHPIIDIHIGSGEGDPDSNELKVANGLEGLLTYIKANKTE